MFNLIIIWFVLVQNMDALNAVGEVAVIEVDFAAEKVYLFTFR